MLSAKIELGTEIRNARGDLIRKVPFRRCHSLLKAFIQVLAAQVSRSTYKIKNTSGNILNITHHDYNFASNPTTDTGFGIIIGNGDTNAVIMEDYNLEAQLATNIAHQTQTFSTENPDSSTWQLAISRGFLNNTGSTVEVKEVGLISHITESYFCLMDRTLYSVSFAKNTTLILTYRITITL